MFFTLSAILAASIPSIIAGFISYKTNTTLIIKEQYRQIQSRLKRTREKCHNLTNLVSKTEKSKHRIFLVSIKLVLHTIYVSFLQYINNSVRKLDRRTYEISYVIEGRLYRMIVRPRRGPSPILQIINENDEDLTDRVLPYMGPQYDWHGNSFQPKFFNCKKLTFELADGTEHTYAEQTNVEYTPRNTR
jgi:hypothetical protein